MADQKSAPADPKPAKAPAKPVAAPVKAADAAAPAKPASTNSAPAKPAGTINTAVAKSATPAKLPAINQKPGSKPAETAKPEPKAVPAAKARPAAPAAKVDQPKIEVPRIEVKAEQRKAKPAVPAQAAIQKIETGAKSMTETINKTREAADQAANQIRTALGNANEQSKVAMEKSARVAEELADLARGNIEALVASQKTAAKYAETLGQGAADYGRRSFEEASAALKSFAEVKSPTDLFRLQSEFARSAFDQLVAESARVSETVVKMTGDVAEPIASRYSVAAERIKSLSVVA